MDLDALGTLFGKVTQSASDAYFRVKEGDALNGQLIGENGQYYTRGQFQGAPSQQQSLNGTFLLIGLAALLFVLVKD